MASIDVVIEVVDARLPEASTNPMVRELRLHRQRPCLKVLNKADLADPLIDAGVDRLLQPPGWRARGGRVVQEARRPGTPPRPLPDPGAASQGKHQAIADDDNGHPERR
jgi:hypothetical protein